MIEITLSNGRTVKCIGMANQHRALLEEIMKNCIADPQTPSPPLPSARLVNTPETVLAAENLTLRQGPDSRG